MGRRFHFITAMALLSLLVSQPALCDDAGNKRATKGQSSGSGLWISEFKPPKLDTDSTSAEPKAVTTKKEQTRTKQRNVD
jgi:hypothetical protein